MESRKSSEFIQAVKTGRLHSVRKFLEDNAGTDITDEYGMGPLHIAALEGHRDIMALLVLGGMDVNVRDTPGRTPLHHAAYAGHKSAVAYLLLKGADPEATSSGVGWSALELANVMRHKELAVMLSLALNGNLKPARNLARSLASSPSNPSLEADRLIVAALLREKDIDPQFEPLITAMLQEIRKEGPQHKYRARPKVMAAMGRSSSGSQSRKSQRFAGIPIESVGTGNSWTVTSKDPRVLAGDFESLYDGADWNSVVDRAKLELQFIAVEDGLRAADLFSEYFQIINVIRGEESYFRCAFDAAFMLYTDDRFFRVLNDYWRSGRSGDVLWFSALMSIAFANTKYFSAGDVYRGVDIHDIDHYMPGLVFRWPFFVSASTNRDIATGFGKNLMIIEVPGSAKVIDIADCSLFPDEGEVFISCIRGV
jgi:hypothetical protein